MSVRTVSVRLLAEISGYVSPIKAATKATSDLKRELSKAASEGKLDAVASSASRFGLALSGGFLVAATAAARFEKAMSEVDAVAGASASEMQALSAAALQAGKDTQYSATEAADAEAELAKAGLSASDILGGALTGSLSLAAAGQLDLSEAADTAAKAMNIFDLSGKDVGHVADVLAAAANKSATDVHELAFALKMGGLAAKNSNVSLEETIGTFAAFADNALTGSDAGTSFKTMLQMLAAPTGKSTELMKKLGLETYDAQGNFVGIAKLAGNLQDKLGGLTEQERNAALATIFGADAMRAATVLYNEGEAGIRKYTAEVNDQGAAAETAAKKTDNLMGDIERLTGSLETLFIEAGTGSNSGIRVLVQMVGSLVDTIGSLPGPVLTVGTVLIGLSGAGLLAFAAFVKIRSSVRDVIKELAEAGPVSARFGTALQGTAKWAGRAAIAVGGLKIAAVALDAIANHTTDVQGLADSLAHLGAENEHAGELARLFGEDLSGFGQDAALAGGGINGIARAIEGTIPGLRQLNEALPGRSFGDAQERIQAVDQQLAEMVRNGNVDGARAAYLRLMQAGKLTASQMEALTPLYQNADREAGKLVPTTAQLAKATTELARATGFAVEEGETLVDLWDRLHGVSKTADEAMLDAKQAIDDVAKSFAENGRAIQGNSEAALKNRIILDEAARKAAAAADAYLAMTGDVAGAQKIMHDFQVAAEKATGATGNAKTEVHKLADEMFKLPENKSIVITATVHLTGTSQLQRVLAELDRRGMREGGVVTHAESGVLREAGVYSPRSPARYAFAEPATKGEAFVPRRGDYGRSMSILDQAAGWYGAQVVPQGWYGGATRGGTSKVEVVVSAAPGSDRTVMGAIVGNLRFDIHTQAAGSAEDYFAPRRGR